MKLSELTALFSKVNSIAGDVEIVLKDAETDIEHVITDLSIHLDPSSGAVGGALTVEHGVAPEPDPAPADPPAGKAAAAAS